MGHVSKQPNSKFSRARQVGRREICTRIGAGHSIQLFEISPTPAWNDLRAFPETMWEMKDV
jgi:hypothetical protein